MINRAFQIATSRLIIRPFEDTQADAFSFEAFVGGDAVSPEALSESDRTIFSALIKGEVEQDHLRCGAFLKDNPGQVVCNLFFERGLDGWELNVETLTRYRGQGYMTEALTAVLPKTGTLGLHFLSGRIHHNNASSLRVARKLGKRAIGSDAGFIHFRL